MGACSASSLPTNQKPLESCLWNKKWNLIHCDRENRLEKAFCRTRKPFLLPVSGERFLRLPRRAHAIVGATVVVKRTLATRLFRPGFSGLGFLAWVGLA